MKVLLVEDHRAMRDLIAGHLRQCSLTIDPVGCGGDALAAMAVARYDAVILDLGLPDMDGMDVLRSLRDRHPQLPALILTARDALSARVDGLDAGADDYILKPFDLAELAARLRTVLRRPGTRVDAVHRHGDLVFDPASRMAAVDGVALDLTRREVAVLAELIGAADRVVVKDTLEERLYVFDDDVSANALEASVSRLRRKIAAAGSAVGIQAVRGIGYRLTLGVDREALTGHEPQVRSRP